MKNLRTLIILLLITVGISVTAQVTINTDNSAPDPSAMLDVKSDNRGLLIPRISTAARDLIPSPATGLLIYNSTTNRFDYYNGSFWHQLGTAFISSTAGTVNPGGGVAINVLPDILPDNSAMLDINDPGRGILIPRISTSARDLIASPATGLIIYNTSTNLLDYYNGAQWIALCSVSTGIPGAGGSQAVVGVAVNTDNSSPDPSAMLDVASADKGVLIPRLTNAQRDAILPVTGLVIYNTSANYIEFYNGSAWYQLITNLIVPPTGGTHVASSNQIIWNWNIVAGATGYKWNTVNDYATATDMASAITKTETGLVCATPHTRYVWAYNDCGFSSALILTKTTLACGTCASPLVDARDGQSYNTVQIGTQCWMAENLNFGTMIPDANNMTNNSITEKYCYENNTANCDTYGGLYQWKETMGYSTTQGVQGICPAGWHIPTNDEWTVLTDLLGSEPVAGGEMKTTGTIEAGTGLWHDPNTAATNSSWFSALPGGYRQDGGGFTHLGNYGNFWTSTEVITEYVWFRNLLFHNAFVSSGYGVVEALGYSVRCLKDTPPPVWSCGDPLPDTRDNQTYNTVQIGTQCWMAENLNIGTTIPGGTDMANNSIIEKYCNENNAANCDTYGGLYQWNEMMGYTTTPGVQGICPTGWHVPTDTEWTVLTDYLGGESIAGGKMKTTGTIEAGTGLWYASNNGATNSSGFSAIPGGYRYGPDLFNTVGGNANFWSSSEYNTNDGVCRELLATIPNVSRFSISKGVGFSVRCVKDIPPTVWSCGDPLPDTRDNQSYNTVQIGTQCWMAENLNIGMTIPGATDMANNSNTEKYCYEDNAANCDTYGGLYQWNEMMQYVTTPGVQGICPTGWHIPVDAEWTLLTAFLGGESIAGGKMKTTGTIEAGTGLWFAPNTGSTNSSGFSALPGGNRYGNGSFYDKGLRAFFWSSTEDQPNFSYRRILNYDNTAVNRDYFWENSGYSVRCVKDIPPPAWSCGQPLSVTHTAGDIAPVNKTVAYGTVETNLTGSNQCWITQNLGSDHQAVSATDATEESAGWYWQFNHKQGYKHDGTTRTPNTAWISSIDENSDWLTANDPCALLLGAGWRLPTSTEWTNADANGGWNNYNQTYASLLKLHAAGYLDYYDGRLLNRGSGGYDWSSAQDNSTNGWNLSYGSSVSDMYASSKAFGLSGRCLKDTNPPVWSCGQPLPVTHTAGDVAPVNKAVSYGTVETNLTGSNFCWITQNLGSDHQAISATDATEQSAGWYWQFNRKQGFKHDGTNRTPNTTWITSINENSDWLAINDPCSLLLGAGWRLPTSAEWTNADANGGWMNYNDTYASVLKLHAAGYLGYSNGSRSGAGSYGLCWSSAQHSTTFGWDLHFTNISISNTSDKANGFSSRCLKDTPPPVWSCGQPLPVTHTAGDVAPVNKAVSYGTVETNLTGSNFCWITQNLGSDHQAVSATDATEESAGWYWQFNRKQGYKHDGTTRTPNASWITSISEDIDWQIWDDPCALSLGSDWRLPTNSEWNNADDSGGWNNSDQAYASVLKLHTAGYLNHSNGVLLSRGSTGLLWSSSYINNNYAWSLGINSTGSATYSNTKHYGFSVRCMKDMNPPAWSCGQPLPVTHTAGDISPVNKTVAYGTVETVLTGSNKCWITQNLGSDHMAVSATDATEESAGWYWQFNRKQGYKHDGTTRTPNTVWISSIDENSDWLTANDPCTLLLGAGWRLPTSAEWWNVNANGGWPNFDQTYASALKLHAAGFLNASHGWLYNRGSEGGGYDWSSTQESSTNGWNLSYGSGVSSMYASSKAYGFSSRCLKDTPPPVWSCGQPLSVTHTAGDISPVNKTVAYGTVETNLTGSNKCWITQNLGADHQAVSATDATEQSAGWYWQFDRKQGFKHDGTTRTPNTTWIYTYGISEYEDWLPANDPCTLLLGNGWRLPTHGEWNSANVNGGWNGFNQAYASVLKLHAAGYLDYHNGSLLNSGSLGFYFSSSQVSPDYGWSLLIGNSGSNMYSNSKYYGFSSRCLKDTPPPVWSCGDPLLDTRDNQTYNTVQIDTQCWMAENLNIGSMTQGGTAMTNNSITEKYCYQNNTTNCDTYGGLYQWYEMMQYATIPGVQGICPAGWHLPADAEWTTLTTFLGGESIAGGKMKTTGTIEAGTGLWHDPNTGATNSSGLSALPGGMMIHDGSSTSMGNYANFWSSTEYYPDYAKYRLLYHSHAIVDNYGGYEGYGLSVRCVKGEYINLPPFQPASPIPQDNTHNHSANTILSWTCTDPENDPLNYDIYFGKNYFPVLVASGQTATSYNPGILENNTLYSWMIVAHDNHSNTTEGLYWSFTTAPSWQCGAPITDARDNQTYSTVQIDTQCWMAENLNFGTMIPGASEMANNSLIEKYCYDDNIANCDVYGGLYQWNEMMGYSTTPGVQGICPAGWHVPTQDEWYGLTDYLGGEPVAGGKMKATGTIEAGMGLWLAPNTGAINTSGFTAIPGGYRLYGGIFESPGYHSFFWSSTEYDVDYARDRGLYYNVASVISGTLQHKVAGFSVRCLRD